MSNEVTGKQVNTPHDKGYKKSLSQPREFLHFLRKYVRADWAQDLQESQLRLADKEYIDKDYEGREADLVYEVTRADGEKIIIFILQELQSTVDFTMIFRILMYIVSVLMRYFTNTDKSVRERKDFKLPAVVPIVFYNGRESWTAVRRLQDYQEGSELFGSHILNLEYYLVNLSDIEQEYILSTNTVLDNIMYCDQLRNKVALAEVIRAAYARTRDFEAQEKEEFENWVEHILLPICGYDAEVAWEILQHARNGEDNMAFEYNIQRIFREEREQAIAEGHAEGHAEGLAEGRAEGHAEGRAEGHAEGLAEAILTLLEDLGEIPKELREEIRTKTDNDVLTKWLKMAARSESIEAFRKVMLL